MSKTESAKPDTSVSFRTSIGGQALIEGILMRGPTRQAIVCRTQDGMVEKVEELHWVREKHPILGWPLIRGVIVFLDSMVKGMKGGGVTTTPNAEKPTTGGTGATVKPYLVRVTIPDLYIRKGPGTNYGKNGFIKPGVYTIVEE